MHIKHNTINYRLISSVIVYSHIKVYIIYDLTVKSQIIGFEENNGNNNTGSCECIIFSY